MRRREFLGAGIGAGLGAGVWGLGNGKWPGGAAPGSDSPSPGPRPPATGFSHSVTRWPFRAFSVDELARMAKELGIASVELLEPSEYEIVRRHGLACAVGYATVPDPSTRLTVGWNRPEHHEWLVPAYERAIAQAAAAGVPNVICFSGNRAGLGDAEGLANCAAGLRQLLPAAERAGVTVIMELLNSKVDHPDYQCDHTPWGVALVERLGSPRFRLLYDIYHMQIMEGDVIRTIRDHHEHIAHFHTAGVPGRHEIDGSQELNYGAVMRAIAETGFAGYVAQEFIPTRDPRTSLKEAIAICTV